MEIEMEDIRVDARDIEMAQRILDTLGVRLDGDETSTFARQLEYVKAQTFDISYAKLKALMFIPLDESADPGADTITYYQWDEVGAAKIVANMADNLPLVDANAKSFTSKVISAGAAYQWSIQDIRRSLRVGNALNQRKAAAARKSVDRRIDEIGASGAPEVGTTGLVNNANVPIVALPNAGAWSLLTAAQLLENLNFLAQSIVTLTLEVEEPNTMILPTAQYGLIASLPYSATTGETVLATFLRVNPYIKAVEQWGKLNAAGAGGVPRIVCYDRDPRVLTYNIPVIYEELPPQAENLAFKVPVHARIGVVEMHYPLACAYADVA